MYYAHISIIHPCCHMPNEVAPVFDEDDNYSLLYDNSSEPPTNDVGKPAIFLFAANHLHVFCLNNIWHTIETNPADHQDVSNHAPARPVKIDWH